MTLRSPTPQIGLSMAMRIPTIQDSKRDATEESFAPSLMLKIRSMTCAGANRKNPITNPMRAKPACMSFPERNAIHAIVVDIARKPPRECVSNTVTIVSPIAMRQALRTHTFFSSRLRKNNRRMFFTSASAKSRAAEASGGSAGRDAARRGC